MSCTLGPHVDPPVLPGPYTIAPPALPPIPVDLTLCCKLVAFSTPPGTLPLPAGTSAVFNAIMTAMFGALLPYFDAIPLTCPKE